MSVAGLGRSAWLVVIANAVPILGVLFLGWDLFLILALFWLENIVIGALGILRVASAPDVSAGKRGIRSAFFVVHFGGFMFAHALLLIEVFGDLAATSGGVTSVPDLLRYLARPDVAVAAVALAISHGWSFVTALGRDTEGQRMSARDAMVLPYRRVFITQAGLLIGALLVEKFGQPVWGLAALLAIKTVLDLHAQRRELGAARPAVTGTSGALTR